MRKRTLGLFGLSVLLHVLLLFSGEELKPPPPPSLPPLPLQARLMLPPPLPVVSPAPARVVHHHTQSANTPTNNSPITALAPAKKANHPVLAEGSSAATTNENTSVDEVIKPTTATIHLPPALELHYELRHENGSILGMAHQRWQPHPQGTYTLSLETFTTGLLALVKPMKRYAVSEGTYTVNGLRPVYFRQYQQGQLREEARFEWSQQRLQFLDGQSQTLPPDTQDLLSLAWQLNFTTHQPIWVSNGRKLSAYFFDELPRENLTLAQQTFSTRHWRKRTNPPEEQLELWLDETGIPVKIRHTDKRGFSTEQVLQRREALNLPASPPANDFPNAAVRDGAP